MAGNIGPQRPAQASAGPQLPARAALPSRPPPDSDSDDDYTPDLPPDMLVSRSIPAEPTVAPKKVLGPTLPPGFSLPSASSSSSYTPPSPVRAPVAAPRKETPLSNLYEDDSDDDFGPKPLPAGASSAPYESEGVRLFRERQEREEEKARKEKEGKGKMVREEWMMVPPEEVSLLASMDVTKLKSRTFTQSAKVAQSTKSSGPNLWTETPAERQQRMNDELLGIKSKAEVSAGGGGRQDEEEEGDDKRRKRERDWALREEVDRHNKSARNTTLLDSHSRTKKAGGNDKNASPGIWDRDRDMSIGGRLMDEGKRADTVQNAKALGGRFGGGSYL